jgi:hypothetical protein
MLIVSTGLTIWNDLDMGWDFGLFRDFSGFMALRLVVDGGELSTDAGIHAVGVNPRV